MDDKVLFVTRPCLYCHRTGLVEVNRIGAIKYMDGQSFNKCFPTESLEVREQIITGTHPECWEEVFGHGE